MALRLVGTWACRWACLVCLVCGCGRSSLDDDLASAPGDVDGGGSTAPTCIRSGLRCTDALDCCSGGCEAGKCEIAEPACLEFGFSCTWASTCCGALSCWNGSCGHPPKVPECAPPGATCRETADCCSGLACAGGTCGGTRSSCKADRTSCSSPSECCTGRCSAFVCGGPFACPPAAGDCGACIAAGCCQEQGVCLLEGACMTSFACFNGCRAAGGGFGCANDCLSKPPTQAENNVYACGFQKCALECQ